MSFPSFLLSAIYSQRKWLSASLESQFIFFCFLSPPSGQGQALSWSCRFPTAPFSQPSVEVAVERPQLPVGDHYECHLLLHTLQSSFTPNAWILPTHTLALSGWVWNKQSIIYPVIWLRLSHLTEMNLIMEVIWLGPMKKEGSQVSWDSWERKEKIKKILCKI